MATPTTNDMLGTLNRLAGTVNAGARAAANKLAGLSGASSLEVVGALNVLAGNGANPSKWRDMMAVCNQLAGTTNLDPLQALQIYLANGGPGTGDQMQLIASKVISSPAATIDFTAIPGTFNNLRLLCAARSTRAAQESDRFNVTFNNDSGGHYDMQSMYTTGTGAPTSEQGVQRSGLGVQNANDMPAAGATAGVAGVLLVDVMNYAATTLNKTGLWRSGYFDPVVASSAGAWADIKFFWESAAAINRITMSTLFGANFDVGSAAFLYGY